MPRLRATQMPAPGAFLVNSTHTATVGITPSTFGSVRHLEAAPSIFAAQSATM